MNAPVKDAIDVLGDARGQPRFLFAADGGCRVGVGINRAFESVGEERFKEMRQAVAQLPPTVTVMGGFAFDALHNAEPPWDAFPSSLFIVPSLEWEWRDGEWLERRNGAAFGYQDLGGSEPPADATKEWGPLVEEALGSIRDGSLHKVVLAQRKRRPALDHPLRAFGRLMASEPEAHAFYFEPIPGHAFFGATPERLVRIQQARVQTHALAGTAPRAPTEEEDKANVRRLLGGQKETLEHRFVVEHIMHRLAEAGLNPEQGMRRIRKMASVMHLETPISASASAGLHVLEVAQALHPTPAVCGTPMSEARAAIARLEGSTRGWYAGGIGWFEHSGAGDLYVPLRAALSTPEATWLHAGAGIVEGSDPAAELQETEAKLAALVQALESTQDAAAGAAP